MGMPRETASQAEGTAGAKIPGQHHAWYVGGTARRPVCSRVSKWERGRRGGLGGMGQVEQDFVSYGEDLGG